MSTLEPEDPREYADLLAGYIAEYAPTSSLEHELVRQMTSATHRLRRLDRIENAAMFTESTAHAPGAAGMERFTTITDLCAKLSRARTQAERAFNRLQRPRTASCPAPPRPGHSAPTHCNRKYCRP
jgi:hypothetical protein